MMQQEFLPRIIGKTLICHLCKRKLTVGEVRPYSIVLVALKKNKVQVW